MIARQPLVERRPPAPTAVLLSRLPADERAAIALARVERFTYRDVAVALGITEESAKRHIRSGLQRLRAESARIDPDGIVNPNVLL